jgi:hypothetical protein
MERSNIFVFVVCGDSSHINTLNFSIRCLKKNSKNQILVVSDKSRNTTEIQHENIIDITTKKEFSHHQASIFLKTSLHKILPSGNNYCYLDSDVIAIGKNADDIFKYISAPIIFASDHSTIDHFSPYAINCDCHDKYKQLQSLLEKHNPYFNSANINNPSTRKLFCFLDEIKKTRASRLFFDLRFHLNKIFRRKYNAGKGFYYCFKTKTWENKNGQVLHNDILAYKDKIEANSNFRFISSGQKWVDENGSIISDFRCNHLIKSIKEKFGITIENNFWRHWNGGVFLFNDESKAFMESWHTKTMAIFSDPSWKVRDQGTLAATAWEFGLQNNPRIPQEFNFIADYFNPFIAFTQGKGFTTDNFKTIIVPELIHIYHNFGNENWDVWQGVKSIQTNIEND